MSAPHHVLIHGGAHGAWCWQDVIAGLAEQGITACAMDLPGCGGDRTPRADVTVGDCVDTVVAHIDGLAVTGAEELAGSRRYLQLVGDKTFPLATSAAFAATCGAVPELLPGDHCIMLTDPDTLVTALTTGASA